MEKSKVVKDIILGVVIVGLVIALFNSYSRINELNSNINNLQNNLDQNINTMRSDNPDREEAMTDALCKSTSSILSSGLTTVIGFLALIFMRFRIGPDLGLALAKGVAISLVTVFVFMPALIITVYPLIEKTRHKSFMPSFKGFGRLVTRIMIPLSFVFIIAAVPSYLASNANSYYYGGSHIYGKGTELGDDTAAIENVFGKSDTYVILVPNGNARAEKGLSTALHEIPEVKSIISYTDTVGAEIPKEYLDKDTLLQLVSDN